MSAGTGPQRGLFNVPVDPVKLGIPDYFKRVLSPMDLVRGLALCACERVCVCFFLCCGAGHILRCVKPVLFTIVRLNCVLLAVGGEALVFVVVQT